jgi:hypothetical protein
MADAIEKTLDTGCSILENGRRRTGKCPITNIE